jgi:hypothetical protein
MMEDISTGKSVKSHCTKCKLSMDHFVVSMAGPEIVKVKCKACGSTHKFRDPNTVKKVRTTRRKVANMSPDVLWHAYMAQARGKELLYNMTGRYRVGDILVHDKFGKGVVRKLSLNKCHVIFQDKERLMASSN